MNQFEMIAMIVLIACAAGVLRTMIRYRDRAPAMNLGQEQRIARLEERIRALEAIVTDQGYDLRKQFKDLEH